MWTSASSSFLFKYANPFYCQQVFSPRCLHSFLMVLTRRLCLTINTPFSNTIRRSLAPLTASNYNKFYLTSPITWIKYELWKCLTSVLSTALDIMHRSRSFSVVIATTWSTTSALKRFAVLNREQKIAFWIGDRYMSCFHCTAFQLLLRVVALLW